MQIEREINIDVSYGEETYQMNITPILNALLAFLTKIFNAYLPEEFDEVLG